MKKVYKLQGLDCAHCAAQMEREIIKLDGIEKASISFLTQKMTLTADENTLERSMDAIVKICSKIEPSMEIIR